jgi:hypothetical protein
MKDVTKIYKFVASYPENLHSGPKSRKPHLSKIINWKLYIVGVFAIIDVSRGF